MKKRLIVALALVVMASVVLVAPATAKQCCRMKPLVTIETMTAGLPDHPDTWYGTARGDIKGNSESWGLTFDPGTPEFGLVDPIFMGGVGPGYNIIDTRRGSITFYTTSLYLDGTWEFRNVGFVTDATGRWRHLLGWMTYGYGFTPDPEVWGDSHPCIEGDQLTCTSYRVFLPPLPADWGRLGVRRPSALWPDIFPR